MNDELQRYYDFYCKGIDNGFDKDVPRVRLSLLAFDGSDVQSIVEKPAKEYPVPGLVYRSLFLNAQEGTMDTTPIANVSEVKHEGHHLTACSVSLPTTIAPVKCLHRNADY